MTDSAFAPTSTRLAVVSRMIVDDRSLSDISAAAAAQAAAVAMGSCAAIMLRGSGSELDVVAAVGDQAVSAGRVFAVVASASIDHDAIVVIDDTAAPSTRWTAVAADATEQGIAGLRAFPIRLEGRSVGAVVVGTAQAWIAEGSVHRDTMGIQVLADLVGIALVLGDGPRGTQVSDSLRSRRTSVVAVEQAIGILAQRHGLTIDAATDVLRGLAVRQTRPVFDVAARIVSGVSLDALVDEIQG